MRHKTSQEILTVLQAVPDITRDEIAALLPDIHISSVRSTVTTLQNAGKIRATGTKEHVGKQGKVHRSQRFSLNDSGEAPPARKMKRKLPSQSGYEARLANLNEELAELKAWKASAIARFPDLAVDPVVLKARKIVAEELRKGGDPQLAHHVMLGQKDETMMMRVTIRGLEDVA
jgi:hypothetical protein